MERASDTVDFLGPLLQALAESLDVREIFSRISVEARRILPHEYLLLGLLSRDGTTIQPIAISGDVSGAGGEISLPGELRLAIERGAYLMRDVVEDEQRGKISGRICFDGSAEFEDVEYDAQPLFRHLARRGVRSYLRVPIHLRGGVVGGLVFCATEPDAFRPESFLPARQIASCVTLAVAHQRLVEEERRSVRLEARVRTLTAELESEGRHRVLGTSKKWTDVLALAGKVAATEATVLLTGESGTGKEVVARFIHRASPRAEGPFVALNCAALPEQLLESELFGHEKGAFTGAIAARAGKIEQAAQGVLFLDEVGEMSPAVQAKLLRVLQEREYERLGGGKTAKADLRVIAATNRDLKVAISQGAFREDLYYRLAVFDLTLPPLRERPEDIPVLADAFLEEIAGSMGRPPARLSNDARARLVAHRWPGNVRELRNAIERALILSDGGLVTSEHVPISMAAVPEPQAAVGGTIDATEREMIVQALARTDNNKSKAARLLGLTRAQLRSRLEKYGLAAAD